MILYLLTTEDAEKALGRELRPGEATAMRKSLQNLLTEEALGVFMDYETYASPENLCPRCEHFIPRDEFPGAYPGALSRVDNQTEICSICGTDEALGNGLVPLDAWPIEGWHPNTIALDAGNADMVKEKLASLEGGVSEA